MNNLLHSSSLNMVGPAQQLYIKAACQSSRRRHQAPVVQMVDSAIRWINHHPLDNTINFDSTYPLDSDLSSG